VTITTFDGHIPFEYLLRLLPVLTNRCAALPVVLGLERLIEPLFKSDLSTPLLPRVRSISTDCVGNSACAAVVARTIHLTAATLLHLHTSGDVLHKMPGTLPLLESLVVQSASQWPIPSNLQDLAPNLVCLDASGAVGSVPPRLRPSWGKMQRLEHVHMGLAMLASTAQVALPAELAPLSKVTDGPCCLRHIRRFYQAQEHRFLQGDHAMAMPVSCTTSWCSELV
jgi:hypothetical protein